MLTNLMLIVTFEVAIVALVKCNQNRLGASSNLVAAGIAQQYGRPIAFLRYLKYGIPATAAQLIVLAFYVWLRFLR